ncbi:MAG: F0F1 ATP synthase subunit delta [Proteobacteria bacterium]|nr:F0F1 ATP synthase subunit delta [Pseudomonadota bacterium]
MYKFINIKCIERLSRLCAESFDLRFGGDIHMLENFADEIYRIASAIRSNKNMYSAIISKVINRKSKAVLFSNFISRDSYSQNAFMLFATLIYIDKLDCIFQIPDAIKDLILKRQNKISSLFIFADKDSKEQNIVSEIEAELNLISKKEFICEFQYKSEIIGGFILQIENNILDASINTQLKRVYDAIRAN